MRRRRERWTDTHNEVKIRYETNFFFVQFPFDDLANGVLFALSFRTVDDHFVFGREVFDALPFGGRHLGRRKDADGGLIGCWLVDWANGQRSLFGRTKNVN